MNKPIDSAEVGVRLRKLRKARGLTLAAVATATGVSKSSISEMESGLRRGITVETVRKLADHYGMPVEGLWNTSRAKDQTLENMPPAIHKALVLLVKAIEEDQRGLLAIQATRPTLSQRPSVTIPTRQVVLPKKKPKIKKSKTTNRRAQASESLAASTKQIA